MPTVSGAIAQYIEEAGTRHVFGVPGGDSLPLIEACRRRGIEFVLTNHETSAGFAAEAYSLCTETPGLCLTTLGPGATNAVTGAAQALLERSPVLFITAQLGDQHYEAMTHQRIDTEALFRPVTKWSATISADNAVTVLRRAHQTMFEGRPGPVHLSLPAHVSGAELPGSPGFDIRPGYPPLGPAPRGEIERARMYMREAARPVILAGLGALRSKCSSAVRALVDRGIPALYTPKVKGLIPEDSPWAVGPVGLGITADEVMRRLLAEADLVLAVGFDQVELVTGWRDALHPDTDLLWVDHASCEDGIYHVDVSLIGDMDKNLRALDDSGAGFDWSEDEVRSIREEVRAALIPDGPEPGGAMSPHRVNAIVRDMLPDDTVVTCDVGSQKLMNTPLWTSYSPGTYLLTNGFSSMGYGLPAAMGAALASDDGQPVVCLAGDGGFAMTMAEMETVVRLQLPVIVVLFDDRALSLIELKQRRRGFSRRGVDFASKDYCALARGFGAEGCSVRTEGELRRVLTEALDAAGPAIIACRVDPAEYAAQM